MKQFQAHFTFYHPGKCYICPNMGCGRTYHLYNSFRRHYLKQHSDSSMLQQASSVQDFAIEQETSTVNNDPLYNVCSATEMQIRENNSTIQSNSKQNTPPLSDTLGQLFSSLYSNPHLPNNVLDTVYSGIHNMFTFSIKPLLPVTSSSAVAKLTTDLEMFSSTYKRHQFFESNGTLINPEPYTVGRRFDYVKKNGKTYYQAVECIAHKIPIRDVLHRFFSLPNILHETIDAMKKLMAHDTSNSIEHYMHGSFWRQKNHGDKIVMPIFLQIDDFETLNPLGSHSGVHKLGAAYISLPCLPYYCASLLGNIFLVLLYHSTDRVEFGNRIIFQPLIDQFNDLFKYGIVFDLPDFKGTIYFELSLILGDNLGLHSVLGFVESFSCNFPCRTCKVEKKVMANQVYEDESLLRTESNYQDDLKTNDSSLTGVKEKCIWLDIENFNLFSQMGFDVMHDMHEGCAKYVMCSLLVVFVDKMKYLTIDIVNNKISSFQYGPDKKDKPVTLAMSNLRKGNIRLNAAEMNTFCKYFGVMFGDFIPRHDKYWQLYIQLMTVLDFIMSPRFVSEQIDYFKYMIAEFCEMYITLFNQSLKPKFHNLLHYHSAMLRFGPLRFLSSMRYEAKHRFNKLAAKSTNNRINMTLTVARKHQLMLNDIFLKETVRSPLSFGGQAEVPVSECEHILDQMQWSDNTKLYKASWAAKCSERYQVNSVIVTAINEENVYFSKVDDIYVDGVSKIILKAKPLQTIGFDNHYHAYNVLDSLQLSPIYIDQETMQYPFVCNCVVIGHNINLPEYHIVLSKPI